MAPMSKNGNQKTLGVIGTVLAIMAVAAGCVAWAESRHECLAQQSAALAQRVTACEALQKAVIETQRRIETKIDHVYELLISSGMCAPKTIP